MPEAWSSIEEIEAIFRRKPMVRPDVRHSQGEERFLAIGRGARRHVFVAFTLRKRGENVYIRPISARYMHRKEVEAYEEENPGL
jgi:uncharacterized protein